ncbi:hypothetical protein CLAFUW4_05274 [Fulvia fulva]|nr:hypothetical protein CLAFUR4_05268 [Fulvia fulva]WPV15163.1 hypothetical protein CLAFUW4_05274 [Fulvia fulva]WPV29987.1 hypothetical protein CLAFUW7_05273 [Fulvia fulva]
MNFDIVSTAVRPLSGCVKSLFTDSRWSDLEIRCGDRSWAVHKIVVCSQCEFFATACDRNSKEATKDVITLQGDLPDAVHALIHFLYTGDYDGCDWLEEDDWMPLVFNVHVYSTAKKGGLDRLAGVAARIFKDRAGNELYEAAFTDAIEELHRHPEADNLLELRKYSVMIAALNGASLYEETSGGGRFWEVARAVPQFAADVLKSVLEEALREKRDEARKKEERCERCKVCLHCCECEEEYDEMV